MRSYRQFCPAARALDLVGERWALLVVRELLLGPKRYTDLQAGLPGVGPNVLAERLRSLERAGVVRKRRLEPPAASTVYELTALGEGLRPVLASLFEWGLQVIGAAGADEAVRASYWLPALEAAADVDAIAAGVEDSYELRVGDEVLSVSVRDGAVGVRQGGSESPDVVVVTDAATFVAIGRGELSPDDTIAAGRLTVEGDAAAAERLAALFAVGGRTSAGSGGRRRSGRASLSSCARGGPSRAERRPR